MALGKRHPPKAVILIKTKIHFHPLEINYSYQQKNHSKIEKIQFLNGFIF
jgi:hypothetical protein